jgi:hypothetical protein
MLASLLAGIRQIRAPLAAGYLWLVPVFFAVRAPTSVDATPGPLRQLLRVVPELGQPATAEAVSFVAYLVGSLSLDLFGLVLPRGVDQASQRFRYRGEALVRGRFAEQVQSSLNHMRKATVELHGIQMKVPGTEREAGRDPEAERRKRSKQDIKAALDRLLPRLDELRAAD